MPSNGVIKMSFDGGRLVRWLYLITGVLTVVHVAVLIVYFWIDDESKFDFVRLVDMDYEGNLPTLFSASLFFLAAALLLVISRINGSNNNPGRETSDRFRWMGISIVFLFLGIDEGTKIHEYVGDWMEQFVDATGWLYFPWVIPYMLAFGLLVIFYFPFYRRLPIEIRRGFLLAAILFLSGAVLIETISAREADMNGTSTITYSVLYTIEEVMEMVGLIVFIRCLLLVIAMHRLRMDFS